MDDKVNGAQDFVVREVGEHLFDIREIEHEARVGAKGVMQIIPPGAKRGGHVLDAVEGVAAKVGVFHDEGQGTRPDVVGEL